eukprot:TRINITY_DN17301_c1_g1_i1.p1 TRINITY_DN17301_c1_g1~~TRINITY_DN17301_c1_g1_i1.p1  ORF type:complete len:309 (-),score=57.59 TRINITY_DN17301_c1_g1_i1:83-1009(-)
MGEIRPAGRESGTAGLLLDASKPYSGLVAETLKRSWKPTHCRAQSFVATGDKRDLEVLKRHGQLSSSMHSQGAPWASKSQGFQRVAIAGYGGHVAGKVAENIYGGTFKEENQQATQGIPLRNLRRTMSEPFRISVHDTPGGTRGLEVAPRVPGYMGTIPGKLSETVHGMRTAESNELAQSLRGHNAAVTSEGWLKRGVWPVDRMATYKWTNRAMKLGGQDLFTEAQNAESHEMNKSLGHTFGLHPPPPNPHKPGDRYLHIKYEKKKEARLDPSTIPAAGVHSYSIKLDGQRWKMHNCLQLAQGNQRMF